MTSPIVQLGPCRRASAAAAARTPLLVLAASVALLAAPPAAASSALAERKGASMRGSGGLNAQALGQELRAAMDEALGCGGHVDEAMLKDIERQLEPMFRTLPKNSAGNIDRRSLRYLVHRYFSRRSSMHVRGFEPARSLQSDRWFTDDILSLQVPAFVEGVLESRHKAVSGFSLDDAAHMVATIQQLIFDDEGSLLKEVYEELAHRTDGSLSREDAEDLLETYLVHWMLGEDQEGAHILLGNRTLLATALPHWQALSNFVRGRVQALEHKRRTQPAAMVAQGLARPGHNALGSKFSFEDTHSMAGEITSTFASFWESECSAMKTQLVEMDTHHTGRVPLSKFYGTGLDADWRFGESEEYLRELGALDETSWRGKQVIIPNYIQAASNCIVSGQHYLVCCMNDCEVLLDEIERKVAAPTARPETILSIVGNMSSHISVDDDLPPQLDASLKAQLAQISEAHGGEVPIHGRLFAQWLHYVFPRECPYPHKTGAVASSTPTQYGTGYVASDEEMKRYASEANHSDVPAGMGKEDLQWMSQWSPEEELITDVGLRAPWERSSLAAGAAIFVAFLLLGVFSKSAFARGGSSGLLPTHQKAHFV